MFGWVITNSDYLVFVTVCGLVFAGLELWLRRRTPAGGLAALVWPSLIVLLLVGFFLVRAAGKVERDRIRDFLQGVAPTYASELELMGHEKIQLDTPANDPLYLKILDAMHRWKQLNPVISDVYTYRVKDGVLSLLVDGPTDYNHDGIISGDREQRVEIGTVYDEADPPMFAAATRGQATFSNEPVTDEWGVWVSAQVPLYGSNGLIEGAMGLDYPAAKWLSAIAHGRRSMLWLLGIPVLMLAFGGTVVGILKAEIGARRNVEGRLKESEGRLRAIFQNLPFPFWVTDDQFCCRLLNQAAADTYALEEGKPLPEACRSSRQPEPMPEEIVRERDGRNYYYYRIRAHLTDMGLCGGEVCLELDMTAHREAEFALRESRERLARHVKQTPLAIIEWDLHHRVLSWNPAAERIFGYKSDEAVGASLLELLVAPAERTEVGRKFSEVLASANSGRITLTNRTKAGRLIQCDWYSTTLVTEDGRLINVASHAEDITERSSLERRLHDTRNLESLGQLAGGVAHEFNNLLTPMLIQVGLIEQTRAGDTQLQDLIKPLESSIMQAAQLTQRVLAVGRNVKDEDEHVNLNDLVADAVALLRKTLDRRIELRVELDTNLPAIWISRSAVTQIVMNLTLNARDTLLDKIKKPPLPNWQPLVLLRTHQTESMAEAESAQFITVSDNGMGMDAEQRSHIFEPFYTTKPAGTGTGLGLAVLWNVVKGLGGSVEVKSVVGAGSSFQVTIPRRRKTDQPPPIKHPQSVPPFIGSSAMLTVPSPPLPLRVLLVDDTPLVVDSLRAVLVAGGHQINCSSDGEEAWALYTEEKAEYDVVVTDLNMPRLSGEGLLERLRNRSRRVGVIVLSGRLETGQESHLKELGADRVLRKPIRPVDLLVAVTTLGAEVRRRGVAQTQA